MKTVPYLKINKEFYNETFFLSETMARNAYSAPRACHTSASVRFAHFILRVVENLSIFFARKYNYGVLFI